MSFYTGRDSTIGGDITISTGDITLSDANGAVVPADAVLDRLSRDRWVFDHTGHTLSSINARALTLDSSAWRELFGQSWMADTGIRDWVESLISGSPKSAVS